MLFLADMPPPGGFESIGWIIVSLAAACVALNQIFGFFKSHMKEKPEPSETYLTKTAHEAAEASRKAAFEAAELSRKEDRKEIKDGISRIEKDFKESKEYQAIARQRIHKRQNAVENALYYMAGREEANGNSHAARVIRERLEAGHKDE